MALNRFWRIKLPLKRIQTNPKLSNGAGAALYYKKLKILNILVLDLTVANKCTNSYKNDAHNNWDDVEQLWLYST